MFDIEKMEWLRQPKDCVLSNEKILITTAPHTDLWQRTYYHFRNDNAPVLQITTEEKFFSFTVKTDFKDSHHRFDQCGIVMYLDSDNWLKASVEYEIRDIASNGMYKIRLENGKEGWIHPTVGTLKILEFDFDRDAP